MRKNKHDAEPATTVVGRLGGCRTVARLVGVSPSAVSRWCTPIGLGGTGGRIPQKWWKQIIAGGKDRGIEITVKELSGLIWVGR